MTTPSFPWTVNQCPNPSFEVQAAVDDGNGGTMLVPEGDLTGYAALTGSTISSTSQDAASGQYSMLVTTDGLNSGEGFTSPRVLSNDVLGTYGDGLYGDGIYGTMTYPINSMSVAFSGESGTLLVSVVADAGIGLPSVVAQVTVALTPAWQTVQIDNLVVPDGDSAYLLVQTPSAQSLSFLVDCVQYDVEPTPHPYIDGSLPGCEWLGDPFASTSILPCQNMITASGGTVVEGSITLIVPGAIKLLVPDEGDITSGGSVTLVTAVPSGSFDDFGLWNLTDPDPAMTYAGWNTAGQLDGNTGYTRNWAIFYPPLDYPVSDGTLLWPRAAYMAAGFQFANIPATQAHNLTGVQVEMMPLASTLDQTPAPSAFDTPRALHLIIRPSRLNYCANPSFEVNLTGWAAAGSATLTRDATVQYGILGAYDGHDFTSGTYSGKATFTQPGDRVQLTVSGLITGDTYTVSMYALPESGGIRDVQIQAAGSTGGVPGAGTAVLPQLNSVSAPAWVRPRSTFVATAPTQTLTIQPITDGTWPVSVGLDACLIEAGEIVGAYFDGDYGNPDYLWAGAAGVTQSYFYPEYSAGQTVINDILTRHTPLSVSAADPSYLVAPTQ